MYDNFDYREGDGLPDTLVGLILMVVGVFLIAATLLILFVSSVSALFLLDYLFLGNIIHWSLEVIWGLGLLLYGNFFLKWSANPTDWIPIALGHRILWDYEASLKTTAANTDENAIVLNEEITKWLKENVSPLMYAKENYNTYYFLRKSDYIAFKLRWT